MPPAMVIRPQTSAAQQRRAAPRQFAVVGERLGEAHGDAGADRGGDADEERVPGIMGGEGGGEHRRQRRHRAVHQADETRLDDLQDEAPARVFVLGWRGVGAGVSPRARRRSVVLAFRLGEVAQQLADRDVARALGASR